MLVNTCKSKPVPGITPHVLCSIAKGMLPFYQTVAASEPFAGQWSRAVVRADLSAMRKLLDAVDPALGKEGLGTNGIGYFITFGFPKTDVYYTNGITIPPGTVRFTFQTGIHRRIAKAVIPFYKELICNWPYAQALAKAIRRKDRKAAAYMVRSLINTKALRSVELDRSGLALTFKYRSTQWVYRNLLNPEPF
ncbi:hypothetical protein AWM70_02100 [Paenibacillus yonginensis]|uniref:Uncharacterized protein n=1 Tax=Paenibacillus yonginensis TaxID=1462996 RepID=A0A1B1MWG1_9BACL|nr:hypothetical protein [Paenibacillus yonginensis]ANS73521.1 hypothetical protein AWM70_02100 [Paenibacillus yonginensis]